MAVLPPLVVHLPEPHTRADLLWSASAYGASTAFRKVPLGLRYLLYARTGLVRAVFLPILPPACPASGYYYYYCAYYYYYYYCFHCYY